MTDQAGERANKDAVGPAPFSAAVVAPTYNHAEPLAGVLAQLEALALPVVMVNDGSTDRTAAVLARWQSEPGRAPRVVITLLRNGGKAAALRAGFDQAQRRGFTHAVTIDTDGQHEPSDLRSLIERAAAEPDAIVIGARRRQGSSAPRASRWGRAISNAMVNLESGVRVDDSQSGMRVYPLARRAEWEGSAERYGFETEVISRAGWHGIPVVETPIRCIYRVPGGRTTHFRLTGDTLRAVAMHARLLTSALKPGPLHGPQGAETGRLPRRLMRWMSLFRLVRMARGDASARRQLAASVGWGLVVATLPFYGVKTLICLWLSGRFRLHPVAVLATSSLSTPPVGLAFVGLSIWTGGLVLHGHAIDPSSVSLRSAATWSSVNTLAWEWLAGSVVAAPVVGLIGYAFVRLILIRRVASRTSGR